MEPSFLHREMEPAILQRVSMSHVLRLSFMTSNEKTFYLFKLRDINVIKLKGRTWTSKHDNKDR